MVPDSPINNEVPQLTNPTNLEKITKSRLVQSDEDTSPIDTSIISWEDFGESKIGGIMGLIQKGAEIREDTDKWAEFEAELDGLKNKGLSRKAIAIIREKIEEAQTTDTQPPEGGKIEAKIAGLLEEYEAHGSEYQYGTVEFTIPVQEKAVKLRVQIPTNFRKNEIRDFTNQAILKDNTTKRLQQDLYLAKQENNPTKIADAKEALRKRLGELETEAPKKLDAESFVMIVAQSAIRDAEQVSESTANTLEAITIDNQAIGKWLAAAHFRMNLSTGSMESVGKDHKVVALFHTKGLDGITKLFEPTLLPPVDIHQLKKRTLARQIRDDVEKVMEQRTGVRDPLDAFVDEQINALKVLMIRRDLEKQGTKDFRKIERDMKDITTLINTLRTGKRERGKPKGLKEYIRSKTFEAPKDKIQAGIGKLQEKLPGFLQKINIGKAEYEGIKLSEDQAKTLVEAESLLSMPSDKVIEETQPSEDLDDPTDEFFTPSTEEDFEPTNDNNNIVVDTEE